MANQKTTAPNQKRIHKFISRHPGCKGEDISKALTLKPDQVGYCLTKLREGKFIKKQGVTRATTYAVTAKQLVL